MLWIWILVILSYYSRSDKFVKVVAEWRDLTTWKQVDERNPDFNVWDIMERKITVTNGWFFTVKNFRIKDFDVFTNETKEFYVDIKPKMYSVVKYQVTANSMGILSYNLSTANSSASGSFKVRPWNQTVDAGSIWEIRWISSSSLNNEFDQYFEVTWNNLKVIDNITFKCQNQTFSFKVKISSNEKVSTLIPSKSLPNGQCVIWSTYKWIWIFSSFSLEVANSLLYWVSVKDFTPWNILSSSWWFVVLQWKGFDQVVAMQISSGQIFDLSKIKIINDNVLVVSIPKWFTTWEYFFRILGKQGIMDVNQKKLLIN